MTYASPEVIRDHLDGYAIEHWAETEVDGQTALGEPLHFHLIEVVTMRLADGADPTEARGTSAPGGTEVG